MSNFDGTPDREIAEILGAGQDVLGTPDRIIDLDNGGGGTTTISIRDEGVFQGTVSGLDFVGGSVTATVAGGIATITVTGGGGGSADFLAIERWSIT